MQRYMTMRNVAGYNQTGATDWTLEILIPLIIVLILLTGGILLSLETGRSERSRNDIAAFETYARYSQELDSIIKQYSEKMPTE